MSPAKKVVQFNCYRCGSEIVMGSRFWGRQVKCKHCGNILVVPTPDDSMPVDSGQELVGNWKWLPVAAAVVLASFLVWSVWLRDTWESDHRALLSDRITQADGNYQTVATAASLSEYRAVLSEIGDRRIQDPELARLVEHSRQRVTDLETKQQQERLAEEARKLKIAKEQEDTRIVAQKARAQTVSATPGTPNTPSRAMSLTEQQRDRENFTKVMEEMYRRHGMDPADAKKGVDEMTQGLENFQEYNRRKQAEQGK